MCVVTVPEMNSSTAILGHVLQAAAEQRKAEEEAIKKQGKVVPAVKLPGAVETKRHLFMSEVRTWWWRWLGTLLVSSNQPFSLFCSIRKKKRLKEGTNNDYNKLPN